MSAFERSSLFESMWHFTQSKIEDINKKNMRGQWRDIQTFDLLLPCYDPRSNLFRVKDIREVDQKEKSADDFLLHSYSKELFQQDIPLLIHQIWFGDSKKKPDEPTTKWETHAKEFGYQYCLWTDSEESKNKLKSFMLSNNFILLEEQLEKAKRDEYMARYYYQCAADICRYEILRHLGGIYADCDMSPPQLLGEEKKKIDYFTVCTPMKGLIFTPEWEARHIGTEGLFGCIGFLMCSPKHPIFERICQSLYENMQEMDKHSLSKDMFPCFHTGSFLFTRCLYGFYTILNRRHLHALKGTNI